VAEPDPFARRVRFDVAGLPITQGSKKAFAHKHTGRVVVVDDNSPDLRSWRTAIGEEARRAQAQLGGVLARDVPVRVGLMFFLPKPQSAPKTRRTYPLTRDLDKLTRAVLDSLESVLYANDGQVVSMRLGKDFPRENGWLGVQVLVEEI
jgi:Holliday junction resolvase RusA-like endonuclease